MRFIRASGGAAGTRVALAGLVLLAASAGPARPQECGNRLGATDPVVYARFGSSVAVDGDRAAIGTLAGIAQSPGAAYVVDLANGTELFRVDEPSDPAPRPDGRFGASVALGGGRLVVGSPSFNGRDLAYVFDAGTGQFLYELEAPDRFDGDGFGTSVAVGEGLLVVGAPKQLADSAPFNSTGQVYVYDTATGALLRTLSPGRSTPNTAGFGTAVAVANGRIVVGAPTDLSTPTERSGAVYVFPAQGGAKAATPRKLVPGVDDAGAGSYFGYSVAVDGDTVVIGAFLDDEAGPDAGAAYVFDLETGSRLRKLTLADADEGDRMGSAVAAGGGLAFAFGPRISVFDLKTGARRSGLPADPATRDVRDALGFSMAVGGGRLLAGAPGNGDRGYQAGEVEVFVLDDLPDAPVVLEPEPASTIVHLSFDIPGFGHFEFERRIVGRIVAETPLECRPPKSFRLTELELRPEEEEPPYTLAPGVEITVHEVGVRLVDPTPAVPVASDGTFLLTSEVRVFGTAEFTSPAASTVIDLASLPPVPFQMDGRIDGSGGPVGLTSTLPSTEHVLDLGLGALNPSYTVSGSLSAHRIKPTFVAVVPSTARRATVTLDFLKESADGTAFSGTFDRAQPPRLGTGVTGVLRVGAHRADVALDAKGRSPKGSPAKLRLKVGKKLAVFQVAISKSDLRAALAARPDADALPTSIPWSLTLPDGWRIEGALPMDGKSTLRTAKDGALARATLRMKPRKYSRMQKLGPPSERASPGAAWLRPSLGWTQLLPR